MFQKMLQVVSGGGSTPTFDLLNPDGLKQKGGVKTATDIINIERKPRLIILASTFLVSSSTWNTTLTIYDVEKNKFKINTVSANDSVNGGINGDGLPSSIVSVTDTAITIKTNTSYTAKYNLLWWY